MFDLVVVPAASLGADLAKLAARAKETENEQAAPIFGENLERRPEIWPSQAGWKFTSQGLLVSGGDIGLIDGEGYGDYRFEFELTVPKEGQGITGWVVRAQDESNCLMFQTPDGRQHAQRPRVQDPAEHLAAAPPHGRPMADRRARGAAQGDPQGRAAPDRRRVPAGHGRSLSGRPTDLPPDRRGPAGRRGRVPCLRPEPKQGLFRAIRLKKL